LIQSIGIIGCVSRATADNEQSVRSLRGAPPRGRPAEAGVAARPEPAPELLETLALAYAAAGRAGDALALAIQAAEVAEARGEVERAASLRARLPGLRAAAGAPAR
jgi:hypothetical protein